MNQTYLVSTHVHTFKACFALRIAVPGTCVSFCPVRPTATTAPGGAFRRSSGCRTLCQGYAIIGSMMDLGWSGDVYRSRMIWVTECLVNIAMVMQWWGFACFQTSRVSKWQRKTLFLDLVTFLLDLDTFIGPYYNSFGDGYPSFGPARPPAGPHPSLLLGLGHTPFR